MLAHLGAGRQRLWLIPAGMLAVYLLNVGRVMLLALNYMYWHGSVKFNHHYTFTNVVYKAIGLLWPLWARRSAAIWSALPAKQLFELAGPSY